jgi:hypothetical protein
MRGSGAVASAQEHCHVRVGQRRGEAVDASLGGPEDAVDLGVGGGGEARWRSAWRGGFHGIDGRIMALELVRRCLRGVFREMEARMSGVGGGLHSFGPLSWLDIVNRGCAVDVDPLCVRR